jgi:hypothetical protein
MQLRPDLDLTFDDVVGLQPLPLVVGVIGPVGQCLLRIELPVRGAQPALRDRHLVAFEPIIEEADLIGPSFFGVKRMEVRARIGCGASCACLPPA